MGKEGQTVPGMSDEWVNTISKRYIELYEKVTGLQFEPTVADEKDLNRAIVTAIEKYR